MAKTLFNVGMNVNGAEEEYINPQIAAEFSTAATYAIGAYCTYQGQVYRFTAAKTAGAWDSTKVTAVNIADDVQGKAPIASPTFTGTPQVPTATAGTNTTQIASTAFVNGAVSTEAAAREAADADLTSAFDAQMQMATSTDIMTGWQNGVTIYTSGSTVDITDLHTASTWKCAVVDCAEGDAFTINGTGGGSPRLWAFIDANGTVLGRSASSATATNTLIIAPRDSAKLIINVNDRSVNCFSGGNLMTAIDAIDEEHLKALGVDSVSWSRYGTIYTSGQTVDITSINPAPSFANAVVECAAGDVFTVTGTGGTSPRLWAFIDSNNNVIENSVANVTVKDTLLTAPDNTSILILNVDTRREHYAFKGKTPPLYYEQIEKLSSIMSLPHAVNILKRVGCIGDSYTAGYIALNGASSGIDYPEYSWPHFMEEKTGNTWTNFGSSGSSTKSWIDNESTGDHSKLAQVKASGNKCQAYVIGLMINDSNPDGNQYVPVGTAADIGTTNNSYYAYLYRLIQAVHQVNLDAPIFVNTCPKSEERYVPYNQAVRDVAAYCASNSLPVFLADLAANYSYYYGNQVYTTDLVGGHYTGIGYEFMAECYYDVISDIITQNVAKFQGIHTVNYDQ